MKQQQTLLLLLLAIALDNSDAGEIMSLDLGVICVLGCDNRGLCGVRSGVSRRLSGSRSCGGYDGIVVIITMQEIFERAGSCSQNEIDLVLAVLASSHTCKDTFGGFLRRGKERRCECR